MVDLPIRVVCGKKDAGRFRPDAIGTRLNGESHHFSRIIVTLVVEFLAVSTPLDVIGAAVGNLPTPGRSTGIWESLHIELENSGVIGGVCNPAAVRRYRAGVFLECCIDN